MNLRVRLTGAIGISAAEARIEITQAATRPRQSLGGIAASDVGAVSSGTFHIDVVVRGADGALWHRSYAD